MPQIERLDTYRFTAEEALSAAFVCVVQGTDDKEVALPGAAGETAIGVTQETADAAAQVTCALPGSYTKVTVSTAVTRGAWLEIAGTSGKVRPVSFTADTNTNLVGKAMTAASNDGEIIYMWFCPQGPTQGEPA